MSDNKDLVSGVVVVLGFAYLAFGAAAYAACRKSLTKKGKFIFFFIFPFQTMAMDDADEDRGGCLLIVAIYAFLSVLGLIFQFINGEKF